MKKSQRRESRHLPNGRCHLQDQQRPNEGKEESIGEQSVDTELDGKVRENTGPEAAADYDVAPAATPATTTTATGGGAASRAGEKLIAYT